MHFKCCWDEALYIDIYQDNATAQLVVSSWPLVNNGNTDIMLELYERNLNAEELKEILDEMLYQRKLDGESMYS